LVALVGAMTVLAVVDLVGAWLARRWADHGSTAAFVGGLGAFLVLFLVYAKSLKYAELSTVTIGWVVLLQVGVIVLDLARGVTIEGPKAVAIALVLALQAYLIAG
jgi:hypothetical protein